MKELYSGSDSRYPLKREIPQATLAILVMNKIRTLCEQYSLRTRCLRLRLRHLL
nr:MAG TPA: hypothetical protein [Caudoviricetes sp.]